MRKDIESLQALTQCCIDGIRGLSLIRPLIPGRDGRASMADVLEATRPTYFRHCAQMIVERGKDLDKLDWAVADDVWAAIDRAKRLDGPSIVDRFGIRAANVHEWANKACVNAIEHYFECCEFSIDTVQEHLMDYDIRDFDPEPQLLDLYFPKIDADEWVAMLRLESAGAANILMQNQLHDVTAADHPPSSQCPPLRREAAEALQLMAKRYPQLVVLDDLEAIPLSRATAGKVIKELIGLGLAHRPAGERGGATVTTPGIQAAKQLADAAAQLMR